MSSVGYGFATFLVASVAFGGAPPAGGYVCDNQGALSVSAEGSTLVQARLYDADGSFAAAVSFETESGASAGSMLEASGWRDGAINYSDETGELTLDFGRGEVVSCRSADSAEVGEEGLLQQAKVSVGPGGGYYPPPYRPYPGYRPPIYAPRPPAYYPPRHYPPRYYPRPGYPHRRW